LLTFWWIGFSHTPTFSIDFSPIARSKSFKLVGSTRVVSNDIGPFKIEIIINFHNRASDSSTESRFVCNCLTTLWWLIIVKTGKDNTTIISNLNIIVLSPWING
jgi:hypothetical protein